MRFKVMHISELDAHALDRHSRIRLPYAIASCRMLAPSCRRRRAIIDASRYYYDMLFRPFDDMPAISQAEPIGA